jgi:hypothetical protein
LRRTQCTQYESNEYRLSQPLLQEALAPRTAFVPVRHGNASNESILRDTTAQKRALYLWQPLAPVQLQQA